MKLPPSFSTRSPRPLVNRSVKPSAPSLTFMEWAGLYGLAVNVVEREPSRRKRLSLPRFYVTTTPTLWFPLPVPVDDDGGENAAYPLDDATKPTLTSVMGNGETIGRALIAFGRTISGRTVHARLGDDGSGTAPYQTINVPKLRG
jgi:hypothetical protein